MKINFKFQKGELSTLIALIGLGIVTVGIIAGRALVKEGPRDLPKAAGAFDWYAPDGTVCTNDSTYFVNTSYRKIYLNFSTNGTCLDFIGYRESQSPGSVTCSSNGSGLCFRFKTNARTSISSLNSAYTRSAAFRELENGACTSNNTFTQVYPFSSSNPSLVQCTWKGSTVYHCGSRCSTVYDNCMVTSFDSYYSDCSIGIDGTQKYEYKASCGSQGQNRACPAPSPTSFACGPSNCPGCCYSNTCQLGSTLTRCGTGGASCVSCASGQSCVSGACYSAPATNTPVPTTPPVSAPVCQSWTNAWIDDCNSYDKFASNNSACIKQSISGSARVKFNTNVTTADQMNLAEYNLDGECASPEDSIGAWSGWQSVGNKDYSFSGLGNAKVDKKLCAGFRKNNGPITYCGGIIHIVPPPTNTPVPTTPPIAAPVCQSWTNAWIDNCNSYSKFINNESACIKQSISGSARVKFNTNVTTADQMNLAEYNRDGECSRPEDSIGAWSGWKSVGNKDYSFSGLGNAKVDKKLCAGFRKNNGPITYCGGIIHIVPPVTNTPTKTPTPTRTPTVTSTPASCVPDLLSPARGAVITVPSLDWTDCSGKKYQVNINGGGTDFTSDVVSSSLYIIPLNNLLIGVQYIWKVRTCDSGSGSSCNSPGTWSSPRSFSWGSVSCTPSITSPSEDAIVKVGDTISWTRCSTAVNYYVEWTDLNTGEPVEGRTDSTSTSYTFTSGFGDALREGTHLKFRVKACNDYLCNSTSSWSQPVSFWWKSRPTEITSTPTPSQEQACTDSGGTWKSFPNSCADKCSYASNPQQNCMTVLTAGCDCGTNKCWNDTACVNNPAVTSPTPSRSPTPSTTPLPGGQCTKPQLSVEKTCKSNGTIDTVWNWGAVNGATQYRIQVDNDSGFGSPREEDDLSGVSKSYNLPNGKWYGRVRVRRADAAVCDDPSDWSEKVTVERCDGTQPTNTPKPPTNTPKPPTNTPKPPTNTPGGPTNTSVPPVCFRGELGNLDCTVSGCIDTADFELFRQAFGKTLAEITVPAGQHTPDLVVDSLNMIDTADYEIFRSNFGSNCP